MDREAWRAAVHGVAACFSSALRPVTLLLGRIIVASHVA